MVITNLPDLSEIDEVICLSGIQKLADYLVARNGV